MKDEILFFERQRFRQAWLWAIIIGVNGIFVYGFIQQVITGHVFGDKPMSNTGLWISLVLSFMLTALFLSIRLDTIIKMDGIYVRFFPIHLQYKKYEWEQVSQIYVRKYHAISEYGGWGYKIMIGSGKAYNISGNMGIQLVLKNQKKLLIGTIKPEEVTEVLKEITHEKS